MSRKKKFYVGEKETIGECLDRMKLEGYTPVRRMEEPVLKETKKGVETAYQRIIFEAEKLNE
ncbi:NETI motif-containing protein [Alkalicoccus halolimnae]|uniref:NETI motif-containing protein n=1 Tax=Alkalicoccus halolimnae TaxID=1667239 RepID=A0A5C7FFF5_9BACI|nr:NETI motif-containing protein [Alkalicoccus halolimnae]TXF86057.1 NETI motif-containing protein [Alkalicoccus halolimnae]